MSDRNLARAVLIRHKPLSDGEIKVCLLPRQQYVLSHCRTTVRDRGLQRSHSVEQASWDTDSVVPTDSLSCGGDVAVCVSGINQPSWPTPFYSVLVSISVFMALSTVFHSIKSPNISPLSHCVLPVLFFFLIGPVNYISLYESLLQHWYNLLWLTGLKAPTN